MVVAGFGLVRFQQNFCCFNNCDRVESILFHGTEATVGWSSDEPVEYSRFDASSKRYVVGRYDDACCVRRARLHAELKRLEDGALGGTVASLSF